MKKILNRILSIPITLYFNFYYLTLKEALFFPIRVSYRTHIGNMGSRSSITITDPRKRIYIGSAGSFDDGWNYWRISSKGVISFDGSASFSSGAKIIVDGYLRIGDNFFCNNNCIINAGTKIEFGENSLVGWDVTILDGDGHFLIEDNIDRDKYDPVIIEDNVWIASRATILKGALIKENSVVAYGAIVTKKMQESSILIGEINEIIKRNISWKR